MKDKEHVEKFRKAIGAINNKIGTTIDTRWGKECVMYRFSINDKQLHQDLETLGIIPNKTYEGLSFPDIPQEFYPDFIRGYFDGDGSISYSPRGNKYILCWVGNKDILTSFKKILGKENITLSQNIKSKITYGLKIGGIKDVERILHYMYDTSTPDTRLDRKYIKVQEALSLRR